MPKEYDVVLLPDASLTQRANAASRSLEQFQTLFTLDGRDAFAHLSLYYGIYLDDAALPKVQAKLQTIASQQPPLHLTASHYQHARGYVGVHYARSAELAALHEAILAAINPLRASKPPQIFKDMSGEEKTNVARYGWNKAAVLYEPHITFARFRDRSAEHEEALPRNVHDFDGTFTQLGVFELGANGTCVRQIFTINL